MVQAIERNPGVSLTEKSLLRDTESEMRAELEFRKQELQMQEKLEQLRIEHEQELRMCEAKARVEKIRAEARLRESEAAIKEAQAKARNNGQTGPQMSLPTGLSMSKSIVFNVAANVKLVPLFQDKDWEAYFSMFEHTL